jgi:hypothetical protein
MNYSELAQQFWRDGYLVLEEFFDGAVMDHLDALIRKQFGIDPSFWHDQQFLTRARTEVIPWFPQKEGVHDFDIVESAAHFEPLTQAILGESWRRLYCMVMYSKPGTNGQAWHQDCAPEDSAVHNLNRLVYTSCITDSGGGQTVLVPGSHRRGLLPSGDPQGTFDGELVLSPKKGTLLLLHGHTWHRVLPIKGAGRVSTNYRAVPAGTPESITDVCVYRNMRYQFSTSTIIEERSTL